MSHRTPLFRVVLGFVLASVVLATCQRPPTIQPSPSKTPILSPSPSATATPFQLAGRARFATSFWEGPDTLAFQPAGSLKVREEIRIKGRYGSFFLVEADGKTGFVSEDAVGSDFDLNTVPPVELGDIPPLSTLRITPSADIVSVNSGLPISSASQILIDVQAPSKLDSEVTILLLEHHPKLTKEFWQQKYLEVKLTADSKVAITGVDGTEAPDANSISRKEIGKLKLSNSTRWSIKLYLNATNLYSIAIVDGESEQEIVSSIRDLPFFFLQDHSVYTELRKLYIGLQTEAQAVSLTARTIPDGSHIASAWLRDVTGDPVAVADKPITSAQSNSLVHLADFGYGLPTRIAYSPDGGLLAIGTKNGTVLIYETGDYQLVQIIDTGQLLSWGEEYGGFAAPPSRPLGGIAISPNNRFVAVVAIDGGLQVWDIEGKELFSKASDAYSWTSSDVIGDIKSGKLQGTDSFAAYFDKQSESVLITARARIYKAFSLKDGQQVSGEPLAKHTFMVGNPNLDYFFWFGANDSNYLVYHRVDWQNMEQVASLDAHSTMGEGHPDGISSNGQWLVYNPSFTPGIFFVRSGENQPSLTILFKGQVDKYGFIADDENHAVVLHSDWPISMKLREPLQFGASESRWQGEVWNIETKSKEGQFSFPAEAYYSIRNDGKTLAYVMPYGIYILSLPDGKIAKEIPFGTCTGGIQAQPNGHLLASFYHSAVYICDGTTGQLLRHINVPTGRINSIAFSPDGKTLASSGQSFTELQSTGLKIDPIIYLWNVEDGSLVKKFDGQGSNIAVLAFSPDGKYVAAGSGNLGYCNVPLGNTSLLLWNIETGESKEIASLKLGIRQITFASDGQTMIVSSNGNDVCGRAGPSTTYLVDLATGAKSTTYSLRSPPDGLNLAADNKTVLLWTGWATGFRAVSINAVTGQVNYEVWEMGYGIVGPVRGDVSPDGKLVAIPMGTKIAITGVDSSTIHNEFPGTMTYYTLNFSSNGQYIYGTGEYPGIIAVWGVSH